MASVLVADDDTAIRETMRMLLEDEGYRVLEAATTDATLAILHSSPERLVVLLDVRMPTDSRGLMRAIAADPYLAKRHVYRLFTASQPLPEVPKLFQHHPIFKPCGLDTLLGCIRQARVQLARQRVRAH